MAFADELVAEIGFEDAMAILETYQGCKWYLPEPHRVTEEHPFAQIVGVEATKKISQRFGAGFLTVPKRTRDKAAIRRVKVRAAYQAGLSINSLCMAFDLHHRTVLDICADVSRCGSAPVNSAKASVDSDLFQQDDIFGVASD